MRKKLIYSFFLFFILIIPGRVMYSQQIVVNRIDLMPNFPEPYEMRNWKSVALGYDSLVFNLNARGEYLPLIFINNNTVNYPGHPSFGLHTVVGTPNPNNGEAINVLPAVVGASLAGIDKSNQNGRNWVLMCEEYFNRSNQENVYLNSPNSSTGDDWWYETMPNVFFYQLYSMYPNTGDFKQQFTTVADRWLEAVNAMGGSTTPWHIPNMNYRAFSLSTMKPNAQGVIEPEAAGAIAWILYMAYTQTGNEKYRIGAEQSMEFLNSLSSNPAYELQLSYGTYMAARMNAELGTNYDIKKIVNWCFDVGPLRSWGAMTGSWGGYDVSGLIGENYQPGSYYAFIMNGFEQAGALVPMVRYDKRFARAIGKWMLNVSNASRLFYPKYLPQANQDTSYRWAQKYDPNSYIAHEAIRQTVNGKTPFATGDAISGGWGKTTLSLYSSSHVGIFAGIIDTTNVKGILRLDLLKTDYFHKDAYPSYLYYNPYTSDQTVVMELENGTHDIYDAVSGSYIKKGVTGSTEITIPADGAVIAVITPAGGTVTYEEDKMLVNGVVVDFQSGHLLGNYPPRIKSLSSASDKVPLGQSTTLYCTAEDRTGNDSISFKWTSSGGSISGTGASVQWNAPDSLGSYLITCTVTDTKGLKDSQSVTIQSVERLNNPPVIASIKADPGKVDLNASSVITCLASDPDKDPLTYTWSAPSGTLSPSGNKASWKSPGAAGNYYITCTVTDTMGGAAKDSVLIPVRDFSLMPTGSLVMYLPFNGNANDESGNGHNGTVYGASLVADRKGNSNSAYRFDGGTNYVLVPNDTSLNFVNGISVCFWMMPGTIFNREEFLVSHGSWQNRWKVSITNRKVRWTVKTTAGVKDLDSKTTIYSDSLYFVAALFNGADFELYINGSLDNFTTFSGTLLKTTYALTAAQMLPGDNNYNFQGVLDDIRLYNYSLPVSEIKNLYTMPVSVDEINKNVPKKYFLSQNYPNPFNPETAIEFHLPQAGQVSLSLYDILGRRVAVLIDEYRPAGVYKIRLSAGQYSLTSGVYFYSIRAGGYNETRKMVILK
ncbi:MAG TPA: LamG-like jellyroll fold domain-containing protein [Ignavibacteriales bacterium]|nr:LamG-like jellyroll fold domain-containing protein [Ignavibacteriales bacterium]